MPQVVELAGKCVLKIRTAAGNPLKTEIPKVNLKTGLNNADGLIGEVIHFGVQRHGVKQMRTLLERLLDRYEADFTPAVVPELPPVNASAAEADKPAQTSKLKGTLHGPGVILPMAECQGQADYLATHSYDVGGYLFHISRVHSLEGLPAQKSLFYIEQSAKGQFLSLDFDKGFAKPENACRYLDTAMVAMVQSVQRIMEL